MVKGIFYILLALFIILPLLTYTFLLAFRLWKRIFKQVDNTIKEDENE